MPDPTLDERYERDTLAVAIGEAAMRVGIYNGEVPLTGPHLLMLVHNLADEIERLRSFLDLCADCKGPREAGVHPEDHDFVPSIKMETLNLPLDDDPGDIATEEQVGPFTALVRAFRRAKR